MVKRVHPAAFLKNLVLTDVNCLLSFCLRAQISLPYKRKEQASALYTFLEKNNIYAMYNYYISNTDLIEECEKEENVGVTGAAAISCLKRALLKYFPVLLICPITARPTPQR
jgi:hypothetical protein